MDCISNTGMTVWQLIIKWEKVHVMHRHIIHSRIVLCCLDEANVDQGGPVEAKFVHLN